MITECDDKTLNLTSFLSRFFTTWDFAGLSPWRIAKNNPERGGRSGRKMVNPPDILALSRAVIITEHIRLKNQANTPTMRVSIILHFEVNIGIVISI